MEYGYHRVIHSDNGTSFSNNVIAELCKIAGIQQTFSTPRNSQGNAICKRANSVILNLFGTLPTNKTGINTVMSWLTVTIAQCTPAQD